MVLYPGIRLPDNNPMQLLRSSHPFEWFDENDLKLFDFSHYRKRQMNFYAIWGVLPAEGSSGVDPNVYGRIDYDNSFNIDSPQKLKLFEYLLQTIRESDAVDPSQRTSSTLWLTEMLNYSNGSCGQDTFNFEHCVKKFARKVPVHEFPDDFSMSLKDGPLFDDKTEKLIGYFMVVPSKHRLLFVSSQIRPFIEDILKLKKEVCHLSEAEGSFHQSLLDKRLNCTF